VVPPVHTPGPPKATWGRHQPPNLVALGLRWVALDRTRIGNWFINAHVEPFTKDRSPFRFGLFTLSFFEAVNIDKNGTCSYARCHHGDVSEPTCFLPLPDRQPRLFVTGDLDAYLDLGSWGPEAR